MISAAATLHAQGKTDIATAAEAAEALRPIAGDFAFALFSLGIIGTAIWQNRPGFDPGGLGFLAAAVLGLKQPDVSALVVAGYSNMVWGVCACVIIPCHVILTWRFVPGVRCIIVSTYTNTAILAGRIASSRHAIGAAMVPHRATSPVIQSI